MSGEQQALYLNDFRELDMIQPMEARRVKLTDLRDNRDTLLLQPKLNGIRALWDPGKGILTTKTGWPITSAPHIVEAVLSSGLADYPLDGEIYKHGLAFQKINGLAQREKPDNETAQLEFHCFDIAIPETPCHERIALLSNFNTMPPLKAVPTFLVRDFQEISLFYERFVKAGYEGIILRDPAETYHEGRGPWLLKIKPEREMEATLIGLNPATPGSKNEGTFGSLLLELEKGKTFKCFAGLSEADRQSLLKKTPLGKPVTVIYGELSTAGIPVSPRFKAVRWDHTTGGNHA